MKKILSIFLLIIILCSAASAELSNYDLDFIGSWVMYMKKGETTYLDTISFFDDNQVVLKTLTFSGSTLVSDHKSSGEWCGLTSGVAVLTLAGKDFAAGIKDDGSLVLMDYQTKDSFGFFSSCPDLSDRLQ